MEISLDKNAFVITADIDRFFKFKEIFNHYKIPLPTPFNACISYNDRGVVGCARSHYTIYKIAQTTKLPYVIIYEDDAFPRKDIIEYSNAAFNNLPHDWKILKLEDTYFESYTDKKYYNEYWFSGKNEKIGSGTCAYVINCSLYNFLIKIIEMTSFSKISNSMPIDVVIRQYIENKYKGYYVSSKMMFLQHNIHNKQMLSNDFNDLLRHTDKEDSKNFEIELFTK